MLQADVARLLHQAMAGRASRHNRHILRWLGLTLKALAHMSEVHVVLLEGYDESISRHDNWRDASKQRTILQARLYRQIQDINIAQRTLTRDFCLAAFRTLIEPSRCTEMFHRELWLCVCPLRLCSLSAVCAACCQPLQGWEFPPPVGTFQRAMVTNLSQRHVHLPQHSIYHQASL